MGVYEVDIIVERAGVDDASMVAALVGELLAEITEAVGVAAFKFELAKSKAAARRLIEAGSYVAFLARRDGEAVGLISLYESYALYAEGTFGTIAELYVRPDFRGAGVGRLLAAAARDFGAERGWTRLEVTTPPLPAFDRTLAFYEREGFTVTGGRKLKALL